MAGPQPTITSLPAAPARGEDRDDFATKANAFVLALSNVFDGEMNDALDWINTVNTEFLVYLAAVQDAEGLPALSGNIDKVLTVGGTVGAEAVGYANYASLEQKSGLKVSRSSVDSDPQHDVAIAAGWIWTRDLTRRINLSTARNKKIDATYAVSTDATLAGGLSDQDTLIDGMNLGQFALLNPTTGAADVIFATSEANALADTIALAAGFTKARFIYAAWVYDAGASDFQLAPFSDGGDGWTVIDNLHPDFYPSVTTSTSAQLLTLPVPPNMQCRTRWTATATKTTNDSMSAYSLITETSQADTSAGANASNLRVHMTTTGLGNFSTYSASQSINMDLKVDSSSQIRHRHSTDMSSIAVMVYAWKMDYTVTDLA